jgi:hypothetical protein
MYAAKRFCCGPGDDKRVPTKQFYTNLFVYNTVVLGFRVRQVYDNLASGGGKC